MNIHRTPFGGRNFEYYAEDGMLSGIIGSRIVKGATGRGVMCYIKHFAVNEQDRNRMTVNATWIQEQALREIYLKPFEMSIKDGNSLAVMTSYNRIGTVWAGGDYRLITGVLRNEWGFNGFVLTDYMDGDWENVDQMLAAGGDGALNTATHNSHATVTCTTEGAQAITYMRRAMHHLLYASVNSNAMNGIDGATKITGGTPIFHRYMQYVNIGLGSLLALSVLMIFVKRKDS
jgi:beta-glucosidase